MSRPEPQVPVPAGPLTVVSALARLSAGELSAQDLLARVTGRADAQDGALGVYLHRTTEAAQVTARDVDRRRSAGTPTGPLAGVPLAVKDIILTADAPTTGQSLLRDRSQVTGDAPVSARLRAADAVLTGKTTTMEFALGFSDPDKPFPTPRNPWDLSRWTGGSSSGTASGIATGMFLTAIGFIAFPARVLAEHFPDAAARPAAARYWVLSLTVVSLAWLVKWSVGVARGHIDARLEPAYVGRLFRNFRLVAAGNVVAAALVFVDWQAGLVLSGLLMAWLLLPPETPRYITKAPVIEGEG